MHFSPLREFIKYIIQHDYVHVLHVDPGLSMAEARVVSVMQQQRRFYDKSRGIRISEKEDIWKLSDEQLTNSGFIRADEAALENDELNWVGTRTVQSDRDGRNRTSQRLSTHKRDTDGADQIRELAKTLEEELLCKVKLEKRITQLTKQFESQTKQAELAASKMEKTMKRNKDELQKEIQRAKEDLEVERKTLKEIKKNEKSSGQKRGRSPDPQLSCLLQICPDRDIGALRAIGDEMDKQRPSNEPFISRQVSLPPTATSVLVPSATTMAWSIRARTDIKPQRIHLDMVTCSTTLMCLM